MQDIKIQNPIQSLTKPNLSVNPVQKPKSLSFGKALQQSIEQVNRYQLEADASITSVSVMAPVDEWIILSFTSSVLSL